MCAFRYAARSVLRHVVLHNDYHHKSSKPEINKQHMLHWWFGRVSGFGRVLLPTVVLHRYISLNNRWQLSMLPGGWLGTCCVPSSFKLVRCTQKMLRLHVHAIFYAFLCCHAVMLFTVCIVSVCRPNVLIDILVPWSFPYSF